MDKHAVCRPPALAAAAAVLALALAATVALAPGPLAAQASKDRQAAAAAKTTAPGSQAARGAQAIVVLVNDEPVTAYEVDQRAAFLALNAGSSAGGADFKARAEARWAQIVKDPKTNERLQQYLRDKGVKSQQEAQSPQGQALQAQFAKGLQKDMIEQLRRESRASALPQFRKAAQEELIDERLKLQEAKRGGIEIGDEDATRMVKGIAKNNEMTPEQFAQHMKGMGVDISTLRERIKAQFIWREVIRRRFGPQISINQRDIERAMLASAGAAAEDMVELHVHRITLPTAGGSDQSAVVRRLAQAEALQRQFGGCKSMAGLAKGTADARFDDLKFIKPSSIPEPTRWLLLFARDGDILPPATTPSGVELYAVCARKTVRADEKLREKAGDELAQKEFEIVAKRHLRDLRQDAHIEYR